MLVVSTTLGCAEVPGADIEVGSWPHHAPMTDVLAGDVIPVCRERAAGRPTRPERQAAFRACMTGYGF